MAGIEHGMGDHVADEDAADAAQSAHQHHVASLQRVGGAYTVQVREQIFSAVNDHAAEKEKAVGPDFLPHRVPWRKISNDVMAVVHERREGMCRRYSNTAAFDSSTTV